MEGALRQPLRSKIKAPGESEDSTGYHLCLAVENVEKVI